MPPNTVSVTRPGPWGNPFKLGKNLCTGRGLDYREEKIDTPEIATRAFRAMLDKPDRNYPSNSALVHHLRGKNLACWCAIGQPCHADVLIELANIATPPAEPRT